MFAEMGFYNLLKFPARIAFYFYCRKILINKKEMLQSEGPLLIAANHPNSFLDAIILATLFKKPIYSLARGDAFANSFFTKVLLSLKMLPVYRISEGAENLEENYKTFSACIDIFKRNGIVLIFSEGLCKNEWHLRKLKKGTARLAVTAWQQGIPLIVLPTGFNYSSFRMFGKNVILNFGEIFSEKDIDENLSGGKGIAAFNLKLEYQLKKLVIEVDANDKERIKKIFFVPQSIFKKIFLFLPAVIGLIIHAPLYYAIVLSIRKKANDHYDSILVGLLIILYPIYLLAIMGATLCITKNPLIILLFPIIPFTAWSLLQLKSQVK
jgi:1-acyl-sn-glycerol-3-phosphate acyltransferase